MADDAQLDLLRERIRQGDSIALGDFIRLHERQLLSFISQNLGTALRQKIEPEDILQELSLEAVKGLEEFRELKCDLFGWLCQLSRYRIVDAHRYYFGSQKRQSDLEVALDAPFGNERDTPWADLLAASLTTASQAFSRDQRYIQLATAVEQLSEEARTALRLRYVENESTKVIAQRLGKSDGSIRVLLTRSLQRLQHILGNTGWTEK